MILGEGITAWIPWLPVLAMHRSCSCGTLGKSLMKCIPSFLLILVVTTQFYCGSPPTDITQQWDKLEEKLDKGVSVLDRFIEARDPRLVDRMNIFKNDKGDLESDLNNILSDAVEILDVSELSALKADINDY